MFRREKWLIEFAQIDERLNIIGNREIATQNEQLLILLAQERLALTNERISLTSPAQGNSDPIPLNFIFILFLVNL